MMDLFDWALENDRNPAAPPPQNPCRRPADELPPEFHAIVQVLTDRRGQQHAITALQIARAARIHPNGTDGSRARRIRQTLEVHYSDLPWPICANAHGFYRPQCAQDLSRYHANLYGRARSILLRIRSLKLVAKAAGYDHVFRAHWQERQAPKLS